MPGAGVTAAGAGAALAASTPAPAAPVATAAPAAPTLAIAPAAVIPSPAGSRRPPRLAQRGRELVGGLVSVRRVLAERAHRDAGERLGDRRLERARVGRRGRDVLHGHGHVGLAAEGDAPGEHLVEHDAEAVEVRALVRRPPLRLLGGEVRRRAHHRAGARQRRVAHARDAEVGDDDPPALVEHDVVRGDVAVDDVARVRGAERREHGEGDGHGLVRRERAVAAQPLLERLAAHVLHGDVGGAVRGAAVVHADDAGMVEAGRGPGLDAEALEELVVGGQPRLEHLDGDQAAEALVLGQIDVRHPSAPERRDDPVPAREQGRHGGGFSVAFVIVHRVMGPWGRDAPAAGAGPTWETREPGVRCDAPV